MSTSKNAPSHPECASGRRASARPWSALAAAAMTWLSAVTASAGPAELFSRITVGSANSDVLALPYYYGGSGMLLSGNAGMSFSLLCSSAVDPSLVREQDVYSTLVSGTGAIQLGGPTGLWTGGQNGCGWSEAPELKGKWVSDLAADPVDPKRTYAATSIMGEANGLYVNDGMTKTWAMLGTTTPAMLGSLHAAKTAAGKIFYTRGLQAVSGMNKYVIRVSEDEGKTWMEHEFPRPEAQDIRILAVDPTDPNRIIVSVVLDTDKTILPNPPDELWVSPMKGAAGSFVKMTQVGVLRGTVFTPDGALYYGDDATDTPGLYVIKKIGEMPMKLMSKPVSCLGYDAMKRRMYACSDYEFGTVDVASGEFVGLIDKRKVSQFVECPGEAPMAMRCKEQMSVNYCAYGHFWQAPVCAGYMLPGTPFDPMLNAKAGAMAPAAAGTAAAQPVAGTMAAPVVAGTPGAMVPVTAGAAAPVGAEHSHSGGCSVGTRGDDAHTFAMLAIAALGLSLRRRRSLIDSG